MMSALYRKLRFKLHSITFKRGANPSLNPAFTPRAEITSLRTKSPRYVVSGIKAVPAVGAVDPKMVSHCAGVRTPIARVSFSVRWCYRKGLTAVLARPNHPRLIALFSLMLVVAPDRAESGVHLSPPNVTKRIIAKLARLRESLRIGTSGSSMARHAPHLFYVLHVAHSYYVTINAGVRIENLSIRWRVVPNRYRVLFSQGVNLIDRLAFRSGPLACFEHSSGSPILTQVGL